MIDIIILANELDDDLEKALYSILYQDESDKLKVFLVNYKDYDCSKIVKYFSNFFKIKELKTDGNECSARQYAIENTKSDYFMFLDQKDILNDNYVMKNILRHLDNFYDVIRTRVRINYYEKMEMEYDDNHLYGIVFKRSFLDDNKIGFFKNINVLGFYKLCFLMDAKIKYLKMYSCFHTDKNDFDYNGFDYVKQFCDGVSEAIYIAEKSDGNIEKISVTAHELIAKMYYQYLKYNSKKYNTILKKLKKIKNICDIHNLTDEKKIDILCKAFQNNVPHLNLKDWLMAKKTFDEFLELIEKGGE